MQLPTPLERGRHRDRRRALPLPHRPRPSPPADGLLAILLDDTATRRGDATGKLIPRGGKTPLRSGVFPTWP